MKLLFATDGSMCSQNALREGARFLDVKNAQVGVVSVMSPEGLVGSNLNADEDIAQAKDFFGKLGVKIEPMLTRGEPSAEILAAARRFQPDVIVIGATSLGAFGRMVFGSVSDEVVHGWPGTVLVVRQKV